MHLYLLVVFENSLISPKNVLSERVLLTYHPVMPQFLAFFETEFTDLSYSIVNSYIPVRGIKVS